MTTRAQQGDGVTARTGRVRLGPSARAVALATAADYLLHVRPNLPPEARRGWRLAAQALRTRARTELLLGAKANAARAAAWGDPMCAAIEAA